MQFSTIQALVGWAFQIEATPLVKIQKYDAQQSSPAFSALTAHDLKAQSAMIMLKVNRLPVEQRAVLWALHVQRETEMLYLTTHTPCRWGFHTDLDIIRKWATGKGLGCREIGGRHQVSFKTANRYEQDVMKLLNAMTDQAYHTLEAPHREMLIHSQYAECLTAG